MSDLTASLTQPSPNSVGRRLAIPHAVLGVLLFVVCEVMFFGGLISAYLVGSAGQSWPPADQPRLPVITTLFNTVVLLCSGWFMYRASLPQRNNSKAEAASSTPLAITIGLGVFFVVFQGYEWVQLIQFGLTIQSSTYGAFFYLIVGIHALHVIAALVALLYVYVRLKQGRLTSGTFGAAKIFWYFVVGLWPVLYILVYLN